MFYYINKKCIYFYLKCIVYDKFVKPPTTISNNPVYFKQLTVVCLVRGILGNIGRVKRKGNNATNTLEGNGRKTLYESLGITQTTNVLTMSKGSNRKKPFLW